MVTVVPVVSVMTMMHMPELLEAASLVYSSECVVEISMIVVADLAQVGQDWLVGLELW